MMLMFATGLLILAALALAWLRLWKACNRRARRWRFCVLMLMQPLAGGLFWLVLFSPPDTRSANILVVATAGTRGRLDAASVILPEAKASGGRAMPDLATALRETGARRVEILGSGLEARDLDAARGVDVIFRPPPPAPGVAALAVDGPVAVGLPLQVVGRAVGTPRGRIELIDPAGAVAARFALASDGAFAIQGMVRAAGPAEWQVRLLDHKGSLKKQLVLPVWVPLASPVRLLVLAGAPGPELKYLRRWAADAGLVVSSRIAAGGGVVLGDQPGRLGREVLAQTDVLVLDERSWADLPPVDRQTVLFAVRAGMGLVLRVTGPIEDAVRRDWRAVAPEVISDDAVPRILGGSSAISAMPLRLVPDDIVIARDGAGVPLAAWRALGRGRVAIWPVQDAQALVLTGETARFETLWSGMLAAVARPTDAHLKGPSIGFVGERMTLCASFPAGNPKAALQGTAGTALAGQAQMFGPDGQTLPLMLDAAGCAAVWPRSVGWFTLMMGQGPPLHIRVLPANAWPGVRAAQRSITTQALAKAAFGRVPAVAPIEGTRMAASAGAPWGWLFLLLTSLAVMWWLERSGRRAAEDITDAT